MMKSAPSQSPTFCIAGEGSTSSLVAEDEEEKMNGMEHRMQTALWKATGLGQGWLCIELCPPPPPKIQ